MKLNYNPDGWNIEDEPIQVPSSFPYQKETKHDNISNVEIYTQPERGGTKLTEGTDYTVDYNGEITFRKSMITFSSEYAGQTLYVWYTTIGDFVEADDINTLEERLDNLTFLDLKDTPDTYSGSYGKYLAVKNGGGVEFVDAPAGGGECVGGLIFLYLNCKGGL